MQKLANLIVILLVIGVSLSPVALVQAAEEAAITTGLSQENLTKKAIREQVTTLRQQRIEKMPYLERGYVNGAINEKKVQQTLQFIQGGKQNLKSAVDRAVQVHTPALAARERIKLAERRILVALRELFPEIEIRYQQRDGQLSSSPFNSQDYRFSFRQPVFRGGILWHTLLQEKATLEAEENEYEKVIGDIIKDVSTAYFEYNRALEVVADHQASLEQVNRFVQISNQKWQEELISEIEYLNVQSLFSQMQYDYESVKQELELAKLELQRFLDIPMDEGLTVQELYNVKELVQQEQPPAEVPGLKETPVYEKNEQGVPEGSEVPNLEVLVDLAYQHRPELQVEAARLEAARLEERVKWGGLLPRADITLEFGKLGEAFNENSLDPKLRKEYRLLLEFQWNLAGNEVAYTFENDEKAPSVSQFQSGSGSQTSRNSFTANILGNLEAFAEIKEAEVEKLERIIELENAEKEVIHDVKQAYYDYQRAMIQVKASLKRVNYRERLVQLAKHRLDNNEVQISEYLQAEIDLSREKTELHKALADYFTAKANLNRAVGMKDFLAIEESYEQPK